MNCVRNLWSAFSRLLTLRCYCNPGQSPLAPLSCSDVQDAVSRSVPPIQLARGWYRQLWKVVCAAVLLPYAAVFAVCAVLSHNETVPYTNRAHRVILSPSIERKVGEKLFEYFKIKHSKDILGPSDPNTARVRLILSDMIHGIQDVFPTNSLRDDANKQGKAAARPQTGHLRDLKWEVIVMRDKSVNAYSLPGGRIVVFTGLLNVLKTDAEIAAIIAHEAGHVVARHFTELTILTPPILSRLLPFQRRNELEADLIGMMLLAAAGFDPRRAPEVCQKLGELVDLIGMMLLAAAGFDPCIAPEVCQKLGELVGDSSLNDYIGHHPSCIKRSRLFSRGDAMKEALELYCNSASKFARGKVPIDVSLTVEGSRILLC